MCWLCSQKFCDNGKRNKVSTNDRMVAMFKKKNGSKRQILREWKNNPARNVFAVPSQVSFLPSSEKIRGASIQCKGSPIVCLQQSID